MTATETVLDEDKQKLARIEKELGITPTVESGGVSAISPLVQMDAQTESDREIIHALIEEFAADEDFDKLLENPNIKHFIIYEFEGEEPFLNRWGKNMLAVISPCNESDLVKYPTGAVPGTIVTKGQLGALELVEKARGVLNIPICVGPGTVVYGNGEPCEIEKFPIGGQVLSREGMAYTTNRITSRYVGTMLKVTPYYTNIPTTMTLNHKVATLKVGAWHKYVRASAHPKAWARLPSKILPLVEWKEASYLQPCSPKRQGKKAIVPRCDYLVIPRDLHIEDIECIDFAKYSRSITKHRTWVSRRLGRVALTEDFMLLIGYYSAEGSASSSKCASRWDFGKDEIQYQADVQRILSETFDLPSTVVVKPEYNVGEVAVNNYQLAAFFMSECGESANTKHLPLWALHLPFAKQRSLLKGLFRGDGCTAGHEHKFSTSSRTLAYQVKFLLDRLGMLSSIVFKKRSVSMLVINGVPTRTHDYWEVHVSGPSLVRLQETFSDPHPYLQMKRPTREIGYVTEDAILLPVKKVEKFWYDGPVYDLSVPEGQSFVTTNMLCHNCVAEGGSDYRVEQARRGTLHEAITVSTEEVRMIDRLVDKHYFAERIMDKLLNTQRALWGQMQKEFDAFRIGTNIAEQVYQEKIVGEGRRGRPISNKVILAIIAVALVAVLLVAFAYYSGVFTK